MFVEIILNVDVGLEALQCLRSDSNNVSTSFSTARPVTAVVGMPEGLVPRSVPDGLTHTLIDLICCLSLDPSAGREHRTARFHLAAACAPRPASRAVSLLSCPGLRSRSERPH